MNEHTHTKLPESTNFWTYTSSADAFDQVLEATQLLYKVASSSDDLFCDQQTYWLYWRQQIAVLFLPWLGPNLYSGAYSMTMITNTYSSPNTNIPFPTHFLGVPFTAPQLFFLICFDIKERGIRVSVVKSDVRHARSVLGSSSHSMEDPISEWYKTVNQQVQKWTTNKNRIYPSIRLWFICSSFVLGCRVRPIQPMHVDIFRWNAQGLKFWKQLESSLTFWKKTLMHSRQRADCDLRRNLRLVPG